MKKAAERVRRSLMMLCLLLAPFSIVTAQISEGGLPYSLKSSYLKSAVELPVYSTRSMNIDELLEEDRDFPTPYRYSVFENLSIDIRSEGISQDLPSEGGKIWRYQIESEQGKALQIYFNRFRLPPGAKLFLYNEDYSRIYGAFTERNNHARNSLMIADFEGNEVVIEYFEPYETEFQGLVRIGSIGKAYRNIQKSSSSEDENGFVNVNCPEGEDWQNEKHSVVRFSFRTGNSGYLCSGALVNNMKNDGTPYFLTANHCLASEAEASTVVAYFNYEFYGCDGEFRGQNMSISGASLLATASNSDYTLLLLDAIPLPSYQPYYAGWDATGDPGEFSVGIHHPNGNPKKISIDDSAAVNYDETIGWQGGSSTPPNSHWKVVFDLGRTSTGSSGSPIFNDQGLIIGQLHGGSDIVDYYGKIDYSWTTASTTGKTLKSFLDPDGTDSLRLEGYYPANNAPDPQLYPQFKNVCDSAGITLFGFSAFEPDQWEWSFSPNDVSFLNGTNSNSKNPVVAFNTKGLYDISLQASNTGGSSSVTFNESVSAGDKLAIDVSPVAFYTNCLIAFDSIVLHANGAIDYTWALDSSSDEYFYVQNDTVNPAKIFPIELPDTATTIGLLLSGSHGKCSTDTVYEVALVKPSNDFLDGAIEIFLGENGSYSNECATIQASEPIPPFVSCTGQSSWCNEYGTGEDIVENSVWFYFIPEASGAYQLSSTGMDNQIAIYAAEDEAALLAGDYILLGANDDVTSTDPNPIIKNFLLTEGEKYWIQVDGSAGGSSGEFVLNMVLRYVLSSNEPGTEKFKMYPQPADKNVIIEWNGFTSKQEAGLKAYNSSGVKIMERIINQQSDPKISIDVSDWSSGIYFIQIETGYETRALKMIKR